jgi:hypothetical protein
MKLLFICKKDNALLNVKTNGLYWDDNINHWFSVSMKSHPNIEFTRLELDCDKIYDLKKLADGYDMVSFYEEDRPISSWGLPEFENVDLDIPKIAFIIDCHFEISNTNWKEKINPDAYIGWQNEKWFRSYFTNSEKYYRTNCYGIDFSRISPNPFKNRIADKPLLSGVIPSCIHWTRKFYNLRKMIYNNESLRHYFLVDTDGKTNIFDNYYTSLSSYCAGFACNTNYISRHYLEVPACRSVMFYEDTEKTEASSLLGFEDGVSGISINEDNFTDKIKYYTKNFKPNEWERIAENGYNLVKNNYTAQQEVDRVYKTLISL